MAEEISRNPDISFRDNHPSPSAGNKFKGQDLPPFSGVDGLESKYIYCKQCGFPINTDVVSEGSGWGNIETEYSKTYATYDDSSYQYFDIIPYDGTIYIDTEGMGGCPFCHASEFR